MVAAAEALEGSRPHLPGPLTRLSGPLTTL